MSTSATTASPPPRRRELLPWEMPFNMSSFDGRPDFGLGLAMAALAAAVAPTMMMTGKVMPRERLKAVPTICREDPKTKRVNKAQLAARKAERRGRK